MLIASYKDNDNLRSCTDLFLNNISNKEYHQYFDIYLTDDIINDYKQIYPPINLCNVKGLAGAVILPTEKYKKMTVLISHESNNMETIFHELGHMFDFIQFANLYCNGDLSLVREHRYYQTFVYWSEFHVKQFDIPTLQMRIGTQFCNQTAEEALQCFKNSIHDDLYEQYAKKFLNKTTASISDLMWYLGEVFVCNIYDTQHQYAVHPDVVRDYGSCTVELFQLVSKCYDFETLSVNIEEFHRLILNLMDV